MPRKKNEKLLGIVVPMPLAELWEAFVEEEEGKIKEHGARAVLLYIRSQKVRDQADRAWKKYKRELALQSAAADKVVDGAIQTQGGLKGTKGTRRKKMGEAR